MDDLAWDNVQPLTELNTASDEFGPSGYEDPTTGQLTIFFVSNRPGGMGANDIYTSTLGADGKFTTPQLVPELSSPDNDNWPNVLPNGLELVLVSNRSGTLGGNDIWISDRSSLTDRWSTPVNLGPTVNTASAEGRAWPYAGGTRIIFFSNRSGGAGADDLYETTRTRTTIIPVVGSVTGYGGTTYKTSVQITNPTDATITGALVFHPAGQQSSASDPRTTYTLNPHETRTLTDVMASIGATGLGSLEVVPTTGGAPSITARIQDGGIVAVPQLTSDNVLTAGSRATLVTPADMGTFRFNVGIRTLSAGVSMTISVYDASGTLVRTTSRTLPPNYFTQMGASDFAGGPVTANQTIVIMIDSGSAAIYGSSVASNGVGSMLQMAVRQ